ncbi:MAG: glycoside hydrolase family 18 protein [Fibromonadaceae bacterium]|jgi:GH18 family chitinase|nr:glycoside hydrolase family 18 protein [Fibromonadaceae bacterium]
MKKIFALLLLCSSTLFAQNKVVAYFPSWAQYSQFTPADVRYNLLTEIRYGYVVPSGSGLAFTDEGDKAGFLDLVKRAKSAKIKIVVAVGGLGNEGAMSEASSNPSGFARAAVAFKSEHGIDGFELDGGAVDAASAKSLVKLANELASEGVSVSIAVPGEASLASALGDVSKIDAVSLWFTDATSASESSVKSNSDNASNARALEAFASAGVSKEKLFAIVPFYGKTFYKGGGLGSSHEGAGSGNDGVLPYKDILGKFNKKENYDVSFDDASQSEVAVGETESIVFNGVPSMQAIAKTVKENGYGGVAAFDISGDHKEPIVSLLVSIGQVLRPEVNYKKKK